MDLSVTGKTKIPLGSLLGQSARSLFPDLFLNESAEVKSAALEVKPSKIIVPPPEFYFNVAKHEEETQPYKVLVPPQPDLNWLANATSGEQQGQAGNVPLALLALGGKAQQEMVEQKLTKMGYVVTTASSTRQALERLSANNYHLVFCSADTAFKEVRRFVDQLPADQRRRTYFVLVGADLHTLYDLEALALSANLVINDYHLPSLELILSKGLRDYEQLFHPLLEILDSSSHLK